MWGPEPVTTVPRRRTTPATPAVTQGASRATRGARAGCAPPASTSSAPRTSTVESATSTIERRRWDATTAGFSVSRTEIPPTTACTSTPATSRAGHEHEGPATLHTGPDGPQREDREEPHDAGEGAVPELDELVHPLLLVGDGGERAGHALGPGGAAEPTAGEPHDPAGDDDADLAHEVGQQDGPHPGVRAAGSRLSRDGAAAGHVAQGMWRRSGRWWASAPVSRPSSSLTMSPTTCPGSPGAAHLERSPASRGRRGSRGSAGRR